MKRGRGMSKGNRRTMMSATATLSPNEGEGLPRLPSISVLCVTHLENKDNALPFFQTSPNNL
jgi:hypothetical protein